MVASTRAWRGYTRVPHTNFPFSSLNHRGVTYIRCGQLDREPQKYDLTNDSNLAVSGIEHGSSASNTAWFIVNLPDCIKYIAKFFILWILTHNKCSLTCWLYLHTPRWMKKNWKILSLGNFENFPSINLGTRITHIASPLYYQKATYIYIIPHFDS